MAGVDLLLLRQAVVGSVCPFPPCDFPRRKWSVCGNPNGLAWRLKKAEEVWEES